MFYYCYDYYHYYYYYLDLYFTTSTICNFISVASTITTAIAIAVVITVLLGIFTAVIFSTFHLCQLCGYLGPRGIQAYISRKVQIFNNTCGCPRGYKGIHGPQS